MEDTAANLTGDSKGAERRRGGGPTALGRQIELGRAALVGDDGGRRRCSGMAELGTDGAMGRRRSAALGDGGGGATQINKTTKCWERGEEEGRYRGGGLLSRVEP